MRRPVGRQRTFVSVRQPIGGPAVPLVIVSSFVTIQFDFLFRQPEAYPYLLNFFLFFFPKMGWEGVEGKGCTAHESLRVFLFFCFHLPEITPDSSKYCYYRTQRPNVKCN